VPQLPQNERGALAPEGKSANEMKSWFRICSLLTILLLPSSLQGQLICNPPELCSCEKEEVSPNLTIATTVRLTGALFDASGAPIQFNRTIVQVLNPKSNQILTSAILDEEGRFDLGIVPPGRFRLIAFWSQEKKVIRLPLFDQPKPVSCRGEDECHLEILLALHGTDQRFESCPPK
jgi:hypothetical protein